MLKETIIVSVIVFVILTISWFYFSWKIEKEDKKKDSQRNKKKLFSGILLKAKKIRSKTNGKER